MIPDKQTTNLELALDLGLSAEEFHFICRILERKPTYAELGVFSAMYSEHCSYKSSRRFFKRFPTTGKRVLQGPGENAGVVDIGGGWAVAFKMESHNHPSFIEPYQGAATGMGGILRDIFTMGARPIAAMNALCFGNPNSKRTQEIVRGVVKGIGDYGNCVGVPDVAGQTLFHPCYENNPLVNAFTLGILKSESIFKGTASGIGNWVVYLGAKTGRDGVHGATMSSKEFNTDEEPDRPTVQVGDPFTEKLLLEATLEVMKRKLVVGIQDMGAAGLTSSSFEMAHRGRTGLEINLDAIPTRESGMSAYELLLSESQERMLLVCEPGHWTELQSVFDKWDLHAEKIGDVVEGNRVRMTYRGEAVVDLPVELVVEAPIPDRSKAVPGDLKQRWFMDRNKLLSGSLDQKLEHVLSNKNFADPRVLFQQYDSTVGNRTQSGPYEDAAVLRLRDIETQDLKLALSVDCNPRVSWLSPREGGRRAVAEAAINVACRGAEPIAITDCLNFGSPENPEVLWQFEESVEGISETCEALKIPVISGNVSFYNETNGVPIHPTPMIGLVGLISGKEPSRGTGLFSTELELGILGNPEAGLGGSLLASTWFGRDCGQPEETDLQCLERTVRFLQKLRLTRLQYALHDISDGGLVVSALEMAFRSTVPRLGLELKVPHNLELDRVLFGESSSRILIAYEASDRTELERLAGGHGIQLLSIGTTHDLDQFSIRQGGALLWSRPLSELQARWETQWGPIFESEKM